MFGIHKKTARTKAYNCPDCQRTDSCRGCWRLTFSGMYETYPTGYNKPVPDACVKCNNHPNNGGSGICHCILGGMVFKDDDGRKVLVHSDTM